MLSKGNICQPEINDIVMIMMMMMMQVIQFCQMNQSILHKDNLVT